ncbi:MAG TPA: hypothetical protein VG432_03370 [Gemmatimonadaceae bacterium]|nr:hypothetical protein [Gemmatimonadaceae bacterium]
MSPFDPRSWQLRPVAPVRQLASARPYTAEASVREFTDSNGVQWTVREIIPEMRVTERRTILTRPGYENGWLSFRCAELSCRIAPYPASWRTISEYELERWCMKARDAARVRGKKGS